MTATTGYQAGIETNQVSLSYVAETTWATLPSSQFQQIRYTSESMKRTLTRQRPGEIPSNREASAALTTQVAAGGSIGFALSYSTFDDWLSGLLGADWGSTLTINGVAADITLTNLSSVTATLSSTTALKFNSVTVGMWIRILGFSNSANNDFWLVTAKASAVSLTVTKATAGAPVTETPTGTNAKVRAQTIVNSTTFKSFYLQKKFSSSLWLRYPGCYITRGTIEGSVGSFLSGSFDLFASNETKSTLDASTGAILAAPTGRVNDPVTGWRGCYFTGVPAGVTLSDFSLTFENTSANGEFGMGSAAAAGVMPGYLTASGSFTAYFSSFTLYDRFTAETAANTSFISADSDGNAYVISLLNANIVDAPIVASGPNGAVMAKYVLEGNPQSAGGTVQLDKLPAT